MDLLTAARLMIAMLPVYKEDVGSPDKAAQLERVAVVTSSAVERAKGWPGTKRELLAFKLAYGDAETHFSQRIGRGECKTFECDAYYERDGKRVSLLSWRLHGGTVVHRSLGWWQLQEQGVGSRERWLRVATDEEASAREATRVVVRMRGTCRSMEREGRDWVRMTFSALAARGCAGSFPGIEGRVRVYRRLLTAA